MAFWLKVFLSEMVSSRTLLFTPLFPPILALGVACRLPKSQQDEEKSKKRKVWISLTLLCKPYYALTDCRSLVISTYAAVEPPAILVFLAKEVT